MYLQQMAAHGFAPVARTRDPVVEMIVRSNIGGIVTKTRSIVVGLPDTIWKDDIVNGLVPTSESARNLIAIEVLYFEKRLEEVLKMHPCEGLMYRQQMAAHKFAPVTRTRDPVVEMIVRSNIGGIDTKPNSIVVGLPDTIWKDNIVKSGLVPTSESARNLYFEKRLKEERRWWNRIRFWRKKVP
jgi:hypothetical protein